MRRDMLLEIFDVLRHDPYISEKLDPQQDITFNRYPETESITRPIIVIDELDEPMEREYADNDSLALSYLIQVDVFTKVQPGINARTLRDNLSDTILILLKEELGMTNVSSAKPEYDKDFKVYRSARRYEGTYYKEDILEGD